MTNTNHCMGNLLDKHRIAVFLNLSINFSSMYVSKNLNNHLKVKKSLSASKKEMYYEISIQVKNMSKAC